MDNRFRVWNKEKKTWETREVFCNQDGAFYTMTLCGALCPLPIKNYIISYCTGLSAAKSYRGESEADRLIFEGDIVKNNIAKGVVKFGNPDFLKDSLCSMFYWEMTEQLDYTHFCFEDDIFTEFKNIEIVGTVFDESEGTE